MAEKTLAERNAQYAKEAAERKRQAALNEAARVADKLNATSSAVATEPKASYAAPEPKAAPKVSLQKDDNYDIPTKRQTYFKPRFADGGKVESGCTRSFPKKGK